MQSRLNLDALLDLMYQATVETLYMVGVAALFTLLLGLPIGVLLVVTRKEGVLPLPRVNMVLGLFINIGRSLPFVVLLIALIPLTRLLVPPLAARRRSCPSPWGPFPSLPGWWKMPSMKWTRGVSKRCSPWAAAAGTW